MADAQISIVAKAIDQASGTLGRIEKSVSGLEKSLGRMSKAAGLVGTVFRGIGMGLGISAFFQLERVISDLVRILPDLVSKGAAWADTVKQITDATGMSAEHASTLAAVQQMVGGTTDNLGRAFAQLARSAVTNQKAFAQLGIQTKDANGHLLDAYDIFTNVREKISETGGSLLSTNAAQKAFGRGALDLLDLLKLSDPQWALYQQQAQKSGLILSESAIQASEDWQRTQNVLGAAITGLASQIFQGAAPALISLVNGITNAIQANMNNIVQFAVQAVNFVAGLIGGFLGIDFGAATLASNVNAAGTAADQAAPKVQRLGRAGQDLAAGTDAGTSAIQRQIDAIDAQIAKLDAVDRRQQWHKEQAQLKKDIEQARVDLAGVQGEYVFAAGMSAAEAELARQKKEDDIKTAQQKLAEAEKKLHQARRQHARDMEKQMLEDQKTALQKQMQMQHQAVAAQKAMLAGQQKALRQWATTQKTDIAKPFQSISASLQQAALSARNSGQQIADAIQTAIFGSPGQGRTTLLGDNAGGMGTTARSGGLIDKIGGLINALAPVATGITNLMSSLGIPGLIAAIAAWKIANIGGGVGGIGVGGLALGVLAAGTVASIQSILQGRTDVISGNLNINDIPPEARPRTAAQRDWFLSHGNQGVPYNDPYAEAYHHRNDYLSTLGYQGPPGWAPEYADPNNLQNFLFGNRNWYGNGSQATNNMAPLGPEAANGIISAYGPLFERFLGDGSLVYQDQQDQTSALGDIGMNTAPIGDGSLQTTLGPNATVGINGWANGINAGVTNSGWSKLFSNIGDVSSWNAGNLKVIGTGPGDAIEMTTGSGGHILVRPDPNGHSFDVTNASGKTFNVEANTPYGKKLAAALAKSGYLTTHVGNTVDTRIKGALVFKAAEAHDEAFWYGGHGAAAWDYNIFKVLNSRLPASSTGNAMPAGENQPHGGGGALIREIRALRKAIESRPILLQVDRRTIMRALTGAGSQTSSTLSSARTGT